MPDPEFPLRSVLNFSPPPGLEHAKPSIRDRATIIHDVQPALEGAAGAPLLQAPDVYRVRKMKQADAPLSNDEKGRISSSDTVFVGSR